MRTLTDRRLGLVVLFVGLLAIGVAQRIAPPMTPPLYDGAVFVEPYRYLVPAQGQRGSPQSADGTEKLDNGASPLTALATAEQPPQAQIFATSGALLLPPGTTSIKGSIAPILPRTLPTDGHIAGNVYRITVTNQACAPLTALASEQVTVVLRGPENTHVAKIERLTDTGWQPLETEDGGFASTYLAVVTAFGDFALVAPGAAGPYPTATPVAAPSIGASGEGGSSSTTAGESTTTCGEPSASASPGLDSGGGSSGAGGDPPIALIGLVVIAVGAGGALAVYDQRRRARAKAKLKAQLDAELKAEQAKRRRGKKSRPGR